jgi:hypothetical protein
MKYKSPLIEPLEGWMLTICFDIDGTLFDFDSQPKKKMIDLAKTLIRNSRDNRVFFWSGGGIEYCQMRLRQAGLPEDRAIAKGSFKPDIAFDDEDVLLGYNNLKVS